MAKNRALTVHFTDATKLSFIFPQQSDENVMAQRVKEILDTHQPEPMDEALAREIDGIVEAASKHLL